MDFDQFIDLCGRSLAPEEYRGDLDASWDKLQQVKPEVSMAEPVPYAEYLRCASVYFILTGRLRDAYDCLAALHGLLDSLPPEWGLRYANYTLLVDHVRRYPPALRFYHERGRPLSIPFLGEVIGADDISVKFMNNVQKYLPTGVPRDQELCQVLNVIHWFPLQYRNLTAQFHPLFPRAVPSHTDGADPMPSIQESSKNLLTYRIRAEQKGSTGIATYLSRLAAEFHIACQGSTRTVVLRELYERYEKQDDRVGMGNCKMIEGDDLSSPCFVSPISLNLVAIDSSSSIGEEILWDPVEADIAFEYPAQVKECYESAQRLFQDCDCKRGQAAVMLRQGCCLHSVARLLLPVGEERRSVLDVAKQKLHCARKLFGRDEVNARMVEAHLILLEITQGITREIPRVARSLGQWAVQNKNEILAHFVGLLMLRFGSQEWLRFSRMDTALLAWECAYEVFKALGDVIPMFQTLVFRAWMQHSMFNSAATRIFIEKAISMVDLVSNNYDSMISSVSDTLKGNVDRKILLASKFNTFWTFKRYVTNIYQRLEDSQAFDEWQSKLSRLIEHDGSFREYREDMIERMLDQNQLSLALSYPESKRKDFWKKALADEVARVKHASAEVAFHRYLEEGDIFGAENAVHQFVHEAESLEQVYTRDLYRILACNRIGDLEKARSILDSMNDDFLFEGSLEGYLQGIGIKSTFQNVAENALTFTVLVEDWTRAFRILDLVVKISPTFFERIDKDAYTFAFRLSHYGAIMLRKGHSEEAFRSLLEARQMLELRRQNTNDVDARIGGSTPGWTGEVILDLARACLSCRQGEVPVAIMNRYDHGHPAGVSWAEHALLFVESNRARAVLDSLQTQTIEGKQVDDRSASISETFYKRRALRTLLGLKQLSPEREKEVLQLRNDLNELESGEHSSVAISLTDATNSVVDPKLLYRSIEQDAVVIEATFGTRGCIAFAVTRNGIEKVHQGASRTVDIRKPVIRLMQIMREMTGYLGEQEERRKQLLGELSGEISSVLLVPFEEIIRPKKHVIFSVSEPLTAFPFAVLVFDGKPLVMHAVVSQIPSLTVLHHIFHRQSASPSLSTSSAATTVSVFAKSPMEQPADVSRDGTELNLHMAGIEAVNIARIFSTWPIEASHLSRQAFREYIKGTSSILHVGTHGDIDYRNPLLSSISIGEDFRVLDLSAIQSNANLLVFAACLSGLGKATFGSSDLLGFSHVVLGTGCQAYMGTLWKVSDFGSMMMMILFYRNLKDKPHLSLATALRDAQVELCQFDYSKASRFLDQLLDDWSKKTATVDTDDHLPGEFVPDAPFLLTMSKMILAQLDWSSPFYWAPFMLMGHGGFCLTR
ncbi:hypothetical protein BO70DRAFT_386141 [Aspergillus heteromorphus CBS 117.55]|uniref:CHAT domain-containing protein n=1 Tax=Aspergillus heteromorphus CBS 117.55 TaxID=1448321 RepID=A0A317WLG7_9EURO|nr:uncharacterized protein BO70DRAFT_386141 [Aspergillus heteromorphus CBS 117.55]PWY86855.1 hypothetical protein BO70DRAFT_386141 [Aspergillus heteromorphus CBS 117.55]